MLWWIPVVILVAYVIGRKKIEQWLQFNQETIDKFKNVPEIVEAYKEVQEAWESARADRKWTWGEIIMVVSLAMALFQLIRKHSEEENDDEPDPTPMNHHTDKVYKIAHCTPMKTEMLQDCVSLGFNVIHTNDTRRMSPNGILDFLDKCSAAGVWGYPRIDRGASVEDIIKVIKDHPALLAVGSDDEAEGERISLGEQFKYYKQVKSVAPDLMVWRNWDGSSEGHSWDEYFPGHGDIKDSCDVVLFCVYPYQDNPDYTLKSEWARAESYINPDTPLIPIMQGFYGDKFTKPSILAQWGFWREMCNSYAVWLYHPDSNKDTGFEKGEMREQVKNLNEEVK